MRLRNTGAILPLLLLCGCGGASDQETAADNDSQNQVAANDETANMDAALTDPAMPDPEATGAAEAEAADPAFVPPDGGAPVPDPADPAMATPKPTAAAPGDPALAKPGTKPKPGPGGAPADPKKMAAADAARAPGAEAAAEGGAGDGQQTKQAKNEYTPGTADYVVKEVLVHITNGDLTGLEDVISESAKGLAKRLRDASVAEASLETLQKQIETAKFLNRRQKRSERLYNFKNDKKEVLAFSVRRVRGDFRVTSFVIRQSK